MSCVRTPRCLNGSQQLREPPQNFCCRSRTAGGRRVRGSFLLKPVASGGVSSHPLQHYWSVCPAVSWGVLAEQICSVQHSSVPEPRGRLGHPAGAGCPAVRALAVGRRCHGTGSVRVPLPHGTSGSVCHRPEFPSPCLPLGTHVMPGEAPGRALAVWARAWVSRCLLEVCSSSSSWTLCPGRTRCPMSELLWECVAAGAAVRGRAKRGPAPRAAAALQAPH